MLWKLLKTEKDSTADKLGLSIILKGQGDWVKIEAGSVLLINLIDVVIWGAVGSQAGQTAFGPN